MNNNVDFSVGNLVVSAKESKACHPLTEQDYDILKEGQQANHSIRDLTCGSSISFLLSAVGMVTSVNFYEKVSKINENKEAELADRLLAFPSITLSLLILLFILSGTISIYLTLRTDKKRESYDKLIKEIDKTFEPKKQPNPQGNQPANQPPNQQPPANQSI